VTHLAERWASYRKVAKPWFDYRCGSVSLCPWERHTCVSYLGTKQSTHCGGPAWRKTCKQNSFCVGVWYDRHRAPIWFKRMKSLWLF